MEKPIFMITKKHVKKMMENAVDQKFSKKDRKECRYSAPCIIGSGMPKKVRNKLRELNSSKINNEGDYAAIEILVEKGVIGLSKGVNLNALTRAQEKFDSPDAHPMTSVAASLKGAII